MIYNNKRVLKQITISLCLSFIFIIANADEVTSFTLVNASSNADIQTLNDGDTVNLYYTGLSLNIRANTSPSTVGSVKFGYDGNNNYSVESVAPYAMEGDNSGDYNSWTPTLGSHTVTGTPYTEASAGGTAGTSKTVSFTVINDDGGSGGAGYDPPADPGTGAVTITGELKKWHKITLSFDGPQYNEADINPNPFKDYRLIVTFTNGSKTYEVPGYFAADGNAGESSVASGNVWRVHFCPDAEGTWNYSASFRIGENVAVSDNASAGTAVPPIDGTADNFSVGPTDKSGRDHRAKGMLKYVGEHYLRYAETGEYFLKCGADAPENFLAYEDFDNTPDNGGRRKSWSPHAGDWNTGDPSWQSGKGTEIIGAVNYLASEQMNAFSFLTMNINGDDKNVFPYISDADFYHFDCSKLDQWEIVFEHADHKGMYLHFKTQETENDGLLDGGSLGIERKLYYRELIARFAHHHALNWNLGEENTQSEQQRKDMAQYFYDHDPYHHHIVLHTYPGQKDAVYTPLLGNASKLTGPSIQTSSMNSSNHDATVTWVENSAGAGKKWVVAVDEPGSASIGTPEDSYTGDPDKHDVRKQAMWGVYLGGGQGYELYFGYQRPHSDLTCEDFRSRDEIWDYGRYALQFFKNNNIPVEQMVPADDLVSSGWCLAKEGEIYVVYLPSGGSTNLTINQDATYNVKWYDPRNGGSLQDGSVTSISGTGDKSLGNAPSSTSEDWAILVTNASGVNQSPIASASADVSSGTVPLTVKFDATASSDPDGSITSYEWDFGDGGSETGDTVSHVFGSAGNYDVILTVTDDNGATATDIIHIEATSSGSGCGSQVTMMSKDFPYGATNWYLDSYTDYDLLAIEPTPPNVATADVSQSFSGESCNYNITFHGVGESDGQSEFDVYVGGSLLGTVVMPLSSSGWEIGPSYNQTWNDVAVANGDQVRVVGRTNSADGTEWSRARWLKIEFNPVGGGGSTGCDAPFEEQDGLVVVEVESVAAASGWTEGSSVSGFTGDSYYEWTGGDRFNNPGNGIQEYEIKINNPGTYHFRWHNKIMHGSNTTESNDSWLRIPDADDFFAKNGSSIKYPNGGMFVQSSTIVNGASSDGWMKVYCSGTTSWTWSARTSDSDAHEIYATFNSAGVYTVQISGRSDHHAIDRFVLFKDSEYTVSQATDLTNDETVCTGSSVGISINNFAASPATILHDDQPQQVTFSADVTDEAPGTIQSVTLNLSNIGGNSAVSMSKSGDTYSYTYTVSGQSMGGKTVFITAEDDEGNTETSELVFSITDETAFAINCGGNAYTASDGILYEADKNYSGGTASTTNDAISGTTDDVLYQSERYGNYSYDIALPNGTYDVTLKMVEMYFNATGERVFDVSVEGTEEITDFDLYQTAGHDVAHDVVVTGVQVSDGELNIQLTSDVNNASLAALSVSMQGSQAYNLTVTNGSNSGSYEENEAVNISADPAPAGEVFDQWTGDAEYLADSMSSATTVTMPAKDISVTATYKVTANPTYSLTVNSGSGGGNYEASATVNIIADGAMAGQMFDQWTGDVDSVVDVNAASTTLTMPASDITITATYKPLPTYTLTVENGSGDGDYLEDATANISADGAPAGQEFDQWTGDISNVADVNAASTTLTMPASDITVTATYKALPTYTLTVENGSGDGDYLEDATANISADGAPAGQEFDQWTGDISNVADVNAASTTLTMPASDITVTATYKAIPTYTLTVESGSGGGDYQEGVDVDIEAESAPDGKVFDKWTGDTNYLQSVTDSITVVTMPAGAVTVTATYKEITGIDGARANSLRIYPNPVASDLYIDADITISRIIILNAIGNCLANKRVAEQDIVSLDASELASGMYFIQIFSENDNCIIKQFIKE